MKLTNIHLEDYRNYETLALDFTKSLTIFLGENAQGKTNLLESIYVLAMTRSHRTSHEKELIAWDKDYARIVGDVQKKNQTIRMEMAIATKGKKTKLNHIEQKKLSDYVGELNVVLFAPEDLYLIKGAPQVRRRFIDMELGQISPLYLYHLSNYQRVLKQRNKYLKQVAGLKEVDEAYLSVLSEQLAESGSHVLYLRYQFIQKLEKWSQVIHQGITENREALSIRYQPSIKIDETHSQKEVQQIYLDDLEKNINKELFKQTTIIGPHRDDLLFFIGEQNVQTFGSQGQQRTTALSLKLAEIELIKAEIGEYPILLLDDVMSELDDERQIHLLKTIEGKVQTFVTTTTLQHLTHRLQSSPDIFMVTNGKVERKSE
ncbi:DNA replication/repair protein RecF [Vagococcus intermedius]|uniref:DNA replication and repair protein RecF n=1 Tax=Vagococcus intermedius TaxID=2991418 RepID=A0AAF0I7V8_9ENTE|nr:DNA replication/repair protein RecF [Vagococcus intermedius]WEG73336.1 DNA replication/repair protein RecF [Vagococcus intermedius]WEG75416.1 DNA replication/repair protein RecF [Vagococcus intermedius]